MTEKTPNAERGILYYAIGEKFIAEAMISARSVRAAMPDMPIAIFTDGDVPEDLFDLRFPINPNLSIKANKMHAMLKSPFAETLFLDTDTYMISPVPELFDLLENFDFAIGLSPKGYLPDSSGKVPASFPVLNACIICWKQSPAMVHMLEDWLARHPNDMSRDQPPLREAAWFGQARWVTFSNVYNFQLDFPQPVRHPVKVLHGRHKQIEKLGDYIQPKGRIRAVLPVHAIAETRILGKKTPRPRLSELVKFSLRLARWKLFGRPD